MGVDSIANTSQVKGLWRVCWFVGGWRVCCAKCKSRIVSAVSKHNTVCSSTSVIRMDWAGYFILSASKLSGQLSPLQVWVGGPGRCWELGAVLVCQTLEGSRVTEQPASPPPPPPPHTHTHTHLLPSDKWPQHGLFISCLERWTVPPRHLLGLSSTPPHVSKCDNSLICQEQRRVCESVCVSVCVCVCVCEDTNSGGLWVVVVVGWWCGGGGLAYVKRVARAPSSLLCSQLCVFSVQSPPPLLSSLLRSQWENLNVQKSESFYGKFHQ